MIYPSDISNLISQWNERTSHYSSHSEYADGIRDCIYELTQLLNRSITEELSYQDFLEMEADTFLCSPEAHEHVA